jgi:putative selenium metabolism protein SsnA
MESAMLITNANIITWGDRPQVLEDHSIYIQDEKITALGPNSEMERRFLDSERLDAEGQYVMPANICAHTHFYGAFARGMPVPGAPPADFLSILQKLWWPLDQALNEEAIRYSVLVCLVEAIRHGTTTLIDHHASPNAIPGSLDIIAEAVVQAGLRAVLCYEVTDRNGIAGAQAGIKENVRMIEKVQKDRSYDGRIAATFGLHASMTVSDTTLEACRSAVAEDAGFHIHVAEAEVDQEDSLSKYGIRVVERLHRFNLLGPTSIFVHAVHVDEHEVNLLADHQTWVTHQPRSNMNNGVGIGDVEKMLKAGVKVCLGNDGFSNAMWEEWKTAYLVHKAWNRDPRRMPAPEIIKMGVENNARLTQAFFPKIIVGTIQEGAAADLIFVDYHPFTPLTIDNLPWHILFGFHESMVTTTISRGQILMHKRLLSTLDEAAIAARAQEIAERVWNRYLLFAPV